MNSALRNFFETTLRQELRDLEPMRERCVLLAAIGIVATFVAIITGLYYKGFAILITAIPLGIAGLLFFKAYQIWLEYKEIFKQDIVKSIVRFANSDWEYLPKRKISEDRFRQSEIFELRVDDYQGDDLIRGKIDDINFECSELCVSHEDPGDTEGRWSLIFKGLFFHADFQKHFLGKTFITSDISEKILGKLGRKLQERNRIEPLIKIEQPDFEHAFAIYSTEPNEARCILTPTMVETILNLKERYNTRVRFSFIESKVYGAISFEENLFNPRILRSSVEFRDVVEMYDLIKIVEVIIRELNLSTEMWESLKASDRK